MADYELHADYNRNGRLEASASEWAQRAVAPGAILVPNLDVDRRQLPASVSLGNRVVLDREQAVILASDDEAARLRIVVNRNTAPANSRFFLRPQGFARIGVRINDGHGRILQQDLTLPGHFPVQLPAAPGALELTLTARTLPGSPMGHITDLNTRFTLDLQDDSTLIMELVSITPAGVETLLDQAHFTIAPFVILDNAATAVRLYCCDIPQNQPSLLELRSALNQIGVPLVTVPADVASGDTWLQDQFQHALIQGPDRWRQVLLHLPRLRSDSNNGTASAGNLQTFVESHFPSRNLGVFNDLWLRELQVSDATGQPRRISFRECSHLATVMNMPYAVARLLIDSIKRIDPTFSPSPPATGDNGSTTWSDVLGWLPALVDEFRNRARRARDAGNAEWSATLDRMSADAQRRVNLVRARLPYNPDRDLVGLPINSGQIEVQGSEANRIFPRVWQMHHSSNYGGNIEASPPTATASLGKLVIGNNLLDGEHDFMDPDLLQLLYKQRKQPIVQLNSSWLHVGHVDEFMTFSPDKRGSGANFAVLRASSGLALRLIRAARNRYLAGVSVDHPHNTLHRPSGVLPRLTTDGTAPVTRLFRGKVWSHSHPVVTGSEIPNVLEPPLIYQDVAQAMNGGDPVDPDSGGINIHGIRYWPGEGPERTYPADITVRELIYGELDMDSESTNAFIEQQFLEPAAQTLASAFEGARVLPLPVIFDRVGSVANWRENPTGSTTAAFTPDVVNLQAINGRLLIPRPYGPRMKLADAIVVIQQATAGMDLPDTLIRRIDERFVRTHHLRTGIYWIERKAPVYRTISGIGTVRSLYDGLETEAQIIDQFKDSFPGATDAELHRRIIEPNRRHFDARGRLRDGWRRFDIAEETVDIFETYIQAVAAELDVPLYWIDSWYYHVHAGGIHCGTNVLRTPATSGRGSQTRLPNVWQAPNLEYGTQPIEFEDDEIIVP